MSERGGQAVIDVWKEDDASGLYKAYIKGSTGRFLLGTMLPERGRLYLRRTVSIDDMKRRGAWPIYRIEEELVYSFRERPGPIEWRDEILWQCVRRLPQHTVCRTDEGATFTFRFDTNSPFPFVPVFCFAQVENGRLYFSFHRDGSPYIFQKKGNDRNETDQQRREQDGKSDHQGTQRSGRPIGV